MPTQSWRLLQEVGRAGRKADSIANGLLLFDEYIDDKRLGLWLKTALHASTEDAALQSVKADMLSTYIKAWRFIYSVYHGKCLSWALSLFYAGANDEDPPTCFVGNNPLCSVCEHTEIICQASIDIQKYLVLLLQTIKDLCDFGLEGVTKTLVTAVLLQGNEQYVHTFEKLQTIFDEDNSCWGCGAIVDDIRMSQPAWHKILYVAVHLSFLDLSFIFRPFDSHYEVHRRYILTSLGESFLANPYSVMSVDPHSSVIDALLGLVHRPVSRNVTQKRGTQLKPRIIDLLEKPCVEGSIECLKFIGFNAGGNDICMFVKDCFP